MCKWTLEGCIKNLRDSHILHTYAVFGVQLALRGWWALNIRDWLKKLLKKHKKEGRQLNVEIATQVLYFQHQNKE